MASLKAILIDAKVDELHLVETVKNAKSLYFTGLGTNDKWKICSTNGTDVWKVELDDDELESYKDAAGVSTLEAFLSKFRKGFLAGDIATVIPFVDGTKVTINVGKGADKISIDVFEAKAAERKAELQNVLFRLADENMALRSDLAAAEKTIVSLKAQKGQGAAGFSLNDIGPKSSNQAKARPKAGMSAVNPNSKKRKAVTGVVFE
ncbi:uncharacterized protein LOC110466054 [Mizuhopecten yessoensis]|uniref:Uncharacterized protein n=1 Tax=Mizuhopecten yessoensis TaxID=6573 RepID=A0A210PQ60_MIZYE|nr:uncharacterized protein LOC110466054 [Mizuhopecten yessoensis]OWF38621.1 hypothetical protein KP79_PYT09943 [Mizuhopecten yessoensis]